MNDVCNQLGSDIKIKPFLLKCIGLPVVVNDGVMQVVIQKQSQPLDHSTESPMPSSRKCDKFLIYLPQFYPLLTEVQNQNDHQNFSSNKTINNILDKVRKHVKYKICQRRTLKVFL